MGKSFRFISDIMTMYLINEKKKMKHVVFQMNESGDEKFNSIELKF